MKQKGFTMIELMVVMAILAALMTMGISTYVQSMKRGRDAKRISDMQEIQKGFELYYAKNGAYAVNCPTMGLDTTLFSSGLPTPPAGGKLYLPTNCTTSSYCYCAEMELASDYANSGAGCNFSAATKTSYCVQNVQ